jgi:hypothetical protein
LEKYELYRIFLTSGLTILGGVLIFVVSQIVLKFVLEPIYDLNKLRGEIAYSLMFYANVYMDSFPSLAGFITTNFGEDIKVRDNVQKIFREQASLLCPKASVIPWFKMWELLKIVPRYRDIAEATTELIGLSNSIHDKGMEFNKLRRDKIRKLLNIKIGPH